MKCSQCYADNTAWAAICVVCGESVLPIALCENGHILPPGSDRCPACPHAWPEHSPFTGPAVLRGILLVTGGQLMAPDGSTPLSFLEVRDRVEPWCLVRGEVGALRLTTGTPSGAVARILMRPSGLRIASRSGVRLDGQPLPYADVAAPGTVTLSGLTLQLLRFQVPSSLSSEP